MSIEVANLIVECFGLLCTISGAFWVFNNSINSRIQRVYKRMDERKDEADKTFVRTDVHNLTISYLEQKTDEKFKSTIQVFEIKMDALATSVKDLIVKLNGKIKGE